MSSHEETRDAGPPTASHAPDGVATRSGVREDAGTSPARLTPVVPGYEVLEEIGHGGMGVVYRARQLGLNREVALKTVPRADVPRATAARFWAEAEVMAAVKHPNVVQVIELGEAEGRPFMAMEYLPGGSLADRLRASGVLASRAAAELVAKVARGVAAAHELGIVHRDLKPGNILFDAAGDPKVADFGLAKRQAVELTQTQAFMGTPAYMAPEQAAGRAKFVGPAADVWALGVILYESAAGKRPFDAGTAESLLSQILSAEASPLRTRLPDTPRDLDTIVMKCLAKEPEHRYPTAAELADDLGRFLRGEPVAARPVGQVERFARWVRRKPAAAAAYAFSFLAVALAVVSVIVAGFWREAERAKDEAVRLRGVADDATANEAAARWEVERERDRLARVGYARNVRFAQNYIRRADPFRAGELLDATPLGLRGWEYGYLRSRCQEWRTQLSGDFVDLRTQFRAAPGPVTSAAFGAGGSRVVVAYSRGPVRLLDAESWATLAEFGPHPSPVRSVAISPDGSRILTACRDGTARVWDAAGLRPPVEIRAGRGVFRGPSFSPDGTRVVADSPEAGTSRVWDAATGKLLLELPGEDGAFSPDGSRIVTAYGFIRVWDASTGKLLLELEKPDQANYAPAFSPDGSRIVCCGETDPPRVWDAATGKLLISMNYTQHTRNPPWVAEFSPDGRRILTTGPVNGPIQLWDAGSGDELLVLEGSGDCAHFSPDGTRILTVAWNPHADDEGWVLVYESRALEQAGRPRETAPPPRPKP